MGMAATLVMWPGAFEQIFGIPFLEKLHMKFDFRWPSGFWEQDV